MSNVNKARKITHVKNSCGKINSETQTVKKQTNTEVKQIET